MDDERPWWMSEPETGSLRDLQTAMSEAEAAVARRMRLGQNDLTAMSQLASVDHPVGPGWLSQRLGVTPAAATELVDRLERAGHLARRRDTADRRRVHLIPSDTALATVGGELTPLLRALDEVVGRYPAEQRDTLRRFLGEVTEVYREFAAGDRQEES